MKVRNLIAIVSTVAAMVVLSAADVQAVTLNINMGEQGSGGGQESIGGEIWNNIDGGATDSTLQFADGSTATGVSATQAGSGSNPGDGAGAGFGGSNSLDSMTTSLVFSVGGTSTTLAVNGLAEGTVWDVIVYAGLNEPNSSRTQTIDVNGTSVAGLGFFDQWQNGPLTFKNQVAVGGAINVAAFNGNTSSIEFIQGVQLVQVVPEPTTAALGLIGCAGMLMRRRRAA